MKLIILTEGGENIGFGHVTRCLSLAQGFEANGLPSELIVAGDSSVEKILANTNYRLINWRENIDQLIRMIKDAIVVVDSYLADLSLYEEISKAAKIPIFFDDNFRLNYPKGVILNWNIHAHDLNYPQKEGLTYLLGSEYISLRNSFWDIKEKVIRENVDDIMVTLGGDDSKNLMPKVLRLLVSQYPKLRKHIIIGGAFKNEVEIKSEADKNTNLIFSPDDKGMKNVMLRSDIAISSGGQTLYELARVGVPTIAIIVADNQENAVKSWQRNGFIELAGYWTNGNLIENLEKKMHHLMDYKKRCQSSKIGQQKVPGNGAEKIVDFIKQSMNENE